MFSLAQDILKQPEGRRPVIGLGSDLQDGDTKKKRKERTGSKIMKGKKD